MNVQKAYKVMQDNCGIGVGDKVKVTRPSYRGEMGWDSGFDWCDLKQRSVGETRYVSDVSGQGLTLEDGNYYPFFILELVEKKKKDHVEVAIGNGKIAKVYEDKIVVGCTTFDVSIINKLEEAYNQVK